MGAVTEGRSWRWSGLLAGRETGGNRAETGFPNPLDGACAGGGNAAEGSGWSGTAACYSYSRGSAHQLPICQSMALPAAKFEFGNVFAARPQAWP
jgi:hypothetical protein